MRRKSDIFFIAMLFCLALIAFFAWMLKDNVDREAAKQLQAQRTIKIHSLRSTCLPDRQAHNAVRGTQYEIAGMGGDDGRVYGK